MTEPLPAPDPLPYRDTKPVGAPDFYFAINATFRFLLDRFGIEGLRRYWRDLGARYYAPVTERWRRDGLGGVAEYWKAFFAAEPGAVVQIHESPDEVRVEVQTCPAIRHLRDHGRKVVPCFCQHCYFVSEAIAAPAGLSVRVTGGDGACVQRFTRHDPHRASQRIEDIKDAR